MKQFIIETTIEKDGQSIPSYFKGKDKVTGELLFTEDPSQALKYVRPDHPRQHLVLIKKGRISIFTPEKAKAYKEALKNKKAEALSTPNIPEQNLIEAEALQNKVENPTEENANIDNNTVDAPIIVNTDTNNPVFETITQEKIMGENTVEKPSTIIIEDGSLNAIAEPVSSSTGTVTDTENITEAIKPTEVKEKKKRGPKAKVANKDKTESKDVAADKKLKESNDYTNNLKTAIEEHKKNPTVKATVTTKKIKQEKEKDKAKINEKDKNKE